MIKIPRNKKSKNDPDSIKRNILIKKNPFFKWVNFSECLLSIFSSITLFIPLILSGLLTHFTNQNYIILTSILSSVILNILFNIYVFSGNDIRDIRSMKNRFSEIKDVNVPLIIQIPTSLLCIYTSYIINPFLSYGIFISISSILLISISYFDFIKSKYYSVKKNEIRDYRLKKIRRNIK